MLVCRFGCGCGAGLVTRCVEHHQRRADGNDVAGLTGQLDHLARYRRLQFDGRFVGHHRADDVLLGDVIADLDEPLGNLGFDRAFAEVGELEDIFAHSISIMLRMPAIMRFLPGKYCHSKACG